MKRFAGLAAALLLVVGAGAGEAFAHDFRSPLSGDIPKISAMLAAAENEPAASLSKATIQSYIAHAYLWQAAGNLRVCFWDGDTYNDLKGSVATIADELTRKIPVKFQWKTGNAFTACPETGWLSFDVRVSLRPMKERLADGDDRSTFFAVIGKPGRTDKSRQATVNLPFLPKPTNELLRSRVLHEFCHVLGCLHEHQRELCLADLNEEKIIARLGAAVYAAQFDAPNSRMAATAHGDFDDTSVMLYSMEDWMFRTKPPASKCYREKDIVKLSSLDEQGLSEAYASGGSKFASMSFDDLLAKCVGLRAQARQLAIEVARLRDRLQTMSNRPQTMATEFSKDIGSVRLTLMEEQLAAIESEASAYDFRQETIDAFRAALSLPD